MISKDISSKFLAEFLQGFIKSFSQDLSRNSCFKPTSEILTGIAPKMLLGFIQEFPVECTGRIIGRVYIEILGETLDNLNKKSQRNHIRNLCRIRRGFLQRFLNGFFQKFLLVSPRVFSFLQVLLQKFFQVCLQVWNFSRRSLCGFYRDFPRIYPQEYLLGFLLESSCGVSGDFQGIPFEIFRRIPIHTNILK